jgi:hypothetical protein
MPLSDIADYSFDFHLSNAKLAIDTRKSIPWGSYISDESFYHFILPLRVNNENLDSFRIIYHNEINQRIKGIRSIEEAALEINHWCHEKVTYQPADSRTSSPLSTIISAQGRCGEESTFTVSALRAAGIPARQMYTPRWAHTDDNHAWVEIWNGREWKYLGACEPEPILDRGWFTEPARRAMLIHTKTFGQYLGDENTIFRKSHYAEINNLDKYAKTKLLFVRVLDSKGVLVTGANVEFQLYNYAELYPLASLTTDSSGYVSFTTGFGDLVIWASLDNRYKFEKVSVGDTDTLILSLPDKDGATGLFNLSIWSPPQLEPFEGIANDLVASNSLRLAQEDSIRHIYIDSWMQKEEMALFASTHNYNEELVIDILSRSMGNYYEICKVLELNKKDLRIRAISLLMEISDKDLRDTPSDILLDHLSISYDSLRHNYPEDIFNKYILNPRILNELITPWRQSLYSQFKSYQNEFRTEPEKVAQWIREHITIYDDENYYGVPISPSGTLKLLSSDLFSSKLLFVAICRSLGIPSRLENGTNTPQYYNNGLWVSTDIYSQIDRDIVYSKVYLSSPPGFITPEYFTHFTIAKYENGRFNTLDYPLGTSIKDFDKGLSLKTGKYMIVSGNRLVDKMVYATVNIFDLAPGEHRSIEINIQHTHNKLKPISGTNYDELELLASKREISLPKCENGSVIAWINHEMEPTKHFLNDLAANRAELDSLAICLILFSDPSDISASYNPNKLSTLPNNITFLLDSNLTILSSIISDRSIRDITYPYVLFSDKNGSVYFLYEGYRVGIGDLISRAQK